MTAAAASRFLFRFWYLDFATSISFFCKVVLPTAATAATVTVASAISFL